MIDFSSAKAATSNAVTADVNALVAAQNGLKLMGYSVMESAGVPALATLRIMNGATVGGGAVMANIKLALSTSQTQWFGTDGIECPNGVTIDFVAGQFDITVFYKVL